MIGQKIREYRKKNKMTMRDLANKSGISNSYISDLENGKNNKPSLDVTNKIAKALGISVSELIGENQTEYIKSIAEETAKKEVNAMYSVIDFVNKNCSTIKYNIEEIIDGNAYSDISSLIIDVTLNRLRHYNNLKTNNSNDDK